MHKIIFLDVDGVLNCAATWDGPHADGFDTLDPAMCDNLAQIVRATQAIVVLSSTWRLYDDTGLAKLTVWLAERDITIHSHTKDLSLTDPHVSRGKEIALWLDEHEEEFPRLERNFVILDDMTDMLHSQKSSFVHTSNKDGLTQAHVDKAIKILTE